MEHTENNTGKIIGALLVGTIVGAGLGLLFAPQTGSEIQKKIVDELKDAVGGLKDKMKEGHCPECGHKHEEEPAKQA